MLLIAYITEVIFYNIVIDINDFNLNSTKINAIAIVLVASVDFVLGMITLFHKNSNRKLAILTLIICALFILAFIMVYGK